MPSLRNMTHRAPAPRVNALVAAAALVSRDAITNTISANATARAAAWQDIAWEHYETCGELRFACEWLGNSLSRARLFAARHRDADAAPEPEPDGSPAAEAMNALAGGADGQAEMLKRFGAHLTVPGESFLVGWDDPETGAQHWLTLCNDEISEDAARNVTVQYLGEKLELPEEALIIRFWRPHPRRHWEANSPARGLDQILTELQKLTMHVGAQADSRLAGAGLLILPNETTFPPPPPDATAPPAALIPGAPSAPQQLAGFYASLADAMVRPIVDRDQASAVVPLVIQVPGEQVGNVKHISFATELSKAALELRQEAIRRLAMGLDMPAEILTGLGSMNHWSAWAIDEASIKAHIEPLLQLICTGLTDSYLRPILGEDPATSDLVVSYDVSALKQRPDRSGVAKDLYTLGELSGQALRREAGFGDADAPGPEEVRRKVLHDLVERAAIDAATAAQILVLLGILDAGDLEAAPAAGELTPGPAPAAPAEDTGGGPQAIPARPDAPPAEQETPPPPAAAMLTAAALLGRHVMDYAGKRLMKGSGGRSVRGQNRDVPTWELHTRIPVPPDQIDAVLEGAYAPFAADTGTSLVASPVLAAVDAACRAALRTGRALTDEALAARLRDALS